MRLLGRSCLRDFFRNGYVLTDLEVAWQVILQGRNLEGASLAMAAFLDIFEDAAQVTS